MSIAEKPSCKEPSDESLPIGWMLSSFGEAATINPSRTKPESNESDVSFLAMGDISEDGRVVTRQVRPYGEVAKGFTSFINNDVLVAKITPCFENGKGALVTNLLEGVGFGSTEFHVIRAKSDIALSAFLYWHTRSDEFRRLGERNMVGSAGQKRVPTDFIREYPLALPPLPEQQKISAILTTVDDKLDVIARQIEATQSLKQGLMQTLFSRGVGTQEANGRWVPHAEFKDSVLGEIPSSWMAAKLDSHVSKVGSGVTPKGGSDSYISSGVPLIRSQNVLVGRLALEDVVFIAPEQHEKMRNSALNANDVLLNITGASIGRCAVLPSDFQEGNVNQHVCIIRTTTSLNPHFLCQYLNSERGQKQINKFQAGGNREGLNYQQIRSFDIPLPPESEQKKIAEILECIDAKVIRLVSKQELFQALKRGLMQKLLTGEWRVRVEASASET